MTAGNLPEALRKDLPSRFRSSPLGAIGTQAGTPMIPWARRRAGLWDRAMASSVYCQERLKNRDQRYPEGDQKRGEPCPRSDFFTQEQGRSAGNQERAYSFEGEQPIELKETHQM
jgi:hypothetical protein